MAKGSSCPTPDGVQDLHLKGTSQQFLLILSLACTAITLLISIALILMHLRRYSAPKEQRQIIRIAFAPFVFALISLAQIYDYSVARYIDPIASFYEAWCVCALFLLFVQYAAPSSVTFGEDLFNAIKAQQETETKGAGNWPRNSWIAVFQYPVVEIIAIIVLEATEASGTYCSTSLRPKYGHFWYSVIHSLGIAIAILAIVRFYGRMKALMRTRRGFPKILAFKAMVGLQLIQNWIFSILLTKNVVHSSPQFTYGDLMYGLPNAIMCVESVIFALVFWYAFSATEYARRPGGSRMPLGRAMLHAMDPRDLLRGVARAVQLVVGGRGERQANPELSKPSPVTRSGRGRYRTSEGTQSLATPERSASRTPLAGSGWQGEFMPPPRYEASPRYLSVE